MPLNSQIVNIFLGRLSKSKPAAIFLPVSSFFIDMDAMLNSILLRVGDFTR